LRNPSPDHGVACGSSHGSREPIPSLPLSRHSEGAARSVAAAGAATLTLPRPSLPPSPSPPRPLPLPPPPDRCHVYPAAPWRPAAPTRPTRMGSCVRATAARSLGCSCQNRAEHVCGRNSARKKQRTALLTRGLRVSPFVSSPPGQRRGKAAVRWRRLRLEATTEQVPARPSSAPPTRGASTSTPRNRRLHQHIRH